MHCVDRSTASGSQSSLTWLPETVGNWKLQVAVIFFYGSGSEPYRYPNSTTVCIDPPFKSEQTYIANFNVTVRSTGTSVTTINPATFPPLYPSGGSSKTTIALPSTLTGAPFSNWSTHSSKATMLSILGTIASVLLFTQSLL
ncbi:hypothetical protein FRC14_008130 [Serendipita sp. 396]|nr:hypothetical protein FRC14_008130 [Serendipita sp. 396]KAG8782626.1 hypothetical protein FRC15_006665 [Serendipita sp. 397]KAG8796744.1 hypothetical protein FRC16_009516 [Serendipita sp. 398]KAG8861130.1 hypothetical protein FRC20_011505 [Serendipita sp. 405]